MAAKPGDSQVVGDADGADDDDYVVDHGDDGGRAILEVAETQPDINHDHRDGDGEGEDGVDQGAVGHLGVDVADALEGGGFVDGFGDEFPERADQLLLPFSFIGFAGKIFIRNG